MTVKLKLSVIEDGEQPHDVADVAFLYFGGVHAPTSPPTTRAVT